MCEFWPPRWLTSLCSPPPDGSPLDAPPTSDRQSGSRTNPSIDVVKTLALVFDVPVSTFYPEPDADEVLRALDVLQAAGAETVLARGAGHLSPRLFRAIADAISQPNPEPSPEASGGDTTGTQGA